MQEDLFHILRIFTTCVSNRSYFFHDNSMKTQCFKSFCLDILRMNKPADIMARGKINLQITR